MYDRMKGAGYAADRVTYGTLISACKEAGDLPRVLSVHKEMQEAGLKADQVYTPSGQAVRTHCIGFGYRYRCH